MKAAGTFSVASLEPGRFQCTLRDGSSPGGDRLVRQRLVEFERSDPVELEIDPSVVSGAEFTGGIVGVSTHPVVVNGIRAVWVAAAVPNPGRRLSPGMTGTAELTPAAGRPSLLASLIGDRQ